MAACPSPLFEEQEKHEEDMRYDLLVYGASLDDRKYDEFKYGSASLEQPEEW